MAKQSKSKAKRKTSTWYQRHVQDPHVKRAQAEGKRSRAVFKLTEVLEHHKLLTKAGGVVIDLGCAPGSWLQEIHRLYPEALLIGVDLLPIQQVAGTTFIQTDFSSDEGLTLLEDALQGRAVDLLLSDMAPEMSGQKLVDQARMIGLNELALDFAVNHLRPGGNMLLKSFMGEGFDEFRGELAGWFTRVKAIKPAASRKSSSELFLLAAGFRGSR
ncbi:MAG: RlmE family RNA methyltransferase [Mariprofundaceae bacterium]